MRRSSGGGWRWIALISAARGTGRLSQTACAKLSDRRGTAEREHQARRQLRRPPRLPSAGTRSPGSQDHIGNTGGRAPRFWPDLAASPQRNLLLRLQAMKGGFHSYSPKIGGRLLQQPLGPAGLTARFRDVPREATEPTEEIAEVDPAVALNKGVARSKAEGPKVHIGFRLAADVVESLKASGPGYNRRVEEALRRAGFGARAKKRRA